METENKTEGQEEVVKKDPATITAVVSLITVVLKLFTTVTDWISGRRKRKQQENADKLNNEIQDKVNTPGTTVSDLLNTIHNEGKKAGMILIGVMLAAAVSMNGCKSHDPIAVTIMTPGAYERIYTPPVDKIIVNGETITNSVWIMTPSTFNYIIEEIHRKYKDVYSE